MPRFEEGTEQHCHSQAARRSIHGPKVVDGGCGQCTAYSGGKVSEMVDVVIVCVIVVS